jgi:hypothetical protein
MKKAYTGFLTAILVLTALGIVAAPEETDSCTSVNDKQRHSIKDENDPGIKNPVNEIRIACVPPPAPIAQNPSVCSGQVAILTASGSGKLSWYDSPEGGRYWGSGASMPTPFPMFTTSNIKTFYVQDSTCAAGPRTMVTVTVYALPNVTVTSPNVSINTKLGTKCAGEPITLFLQGASTYVFRGGGFQPTSGVPFYPPVLPSYPGRVSYVVDGTDTNGCMETDFIDFNINPLPAVTIIASDTSVCAGSSVTLTGAGASSYSWSGGVSNGVAFVPSGSASYTVTGTDVNNCSNSATKNITVNPTPVASAGNDQTIIIGDSARLIGTGGSTYRWTYNNAFLSAKDTIIVKPQTSSTYSVIVTNVFKCSSSANVTVNVNSIHNNCVPPTAPTASNPAVCEGSYATLSATGTGKLSWYDAPSGGTYLGSGASILTPYAMFTNTVNKTFYVQDSTCAAGPRTGVTVTVYPAPQVTANAKATSICSGGSITLFGGGASTYTWTGTYVNPTNNVAFVHPALPSYPNTQQFFVIGKDIHNCVSAKVPISITINPLPNVTATASAARVCPGTPITLTGGGALSYTWSDGVRGFANGVSFVPPYTDTYTVTGKDGNNCTKTASVSVGVNYTAGAGNDQAILKGASAQLTGTGWLSNDKYQWTSDHGYSSNLDKITVSPDTTTTYTFTVISTISATVSCTTSAKVKVSVVNNCVPPPAPRAQNFGFCMYQAPIFRASGTGKLSWYDAATGGNYMGTGDSMQFRYQMASDLSLYVQDSTCIAGPRTKVTATVNPLPNVTVTSPGVSPNTNLGYKCAGDPITLIFGGASTYVTKGGGFQPVSGVPFYPPVFPSYPETMFYDIVGTDINGCTGQTASITFIINPLPTLTVSASDSIVCAGTPVTLTASSPLSFSWSGGVSNGVRFVPSATASYTVTTAKDANNCSNSITKTITVNPLPVANAGSDQTIIKGSSAQLTGTGEGTYQWTSSQGFSSSRDTILVSPDTTTAYKLTVTSPYHCISSDSVIVNVVKDTSNHTVTVWVGNNGGDWNTPGNWSTGKVPQATDHVIIQKGSAPVITGNVTIAGLVIEAGANLTVNGTLNLYGDFANNGNTTGSGTIVLKGNALQEISGTNPISVNLSIDNTSGVEIMGPVTLEGYLHLNAGQLISNHNLTIDLNTGGIAYHAGDSGSISGGILLQKAISSSYHIFAAPAEGISKASVLSDAATRDFYTYDETDHSTKGSDGSYNGWQQVTEPVLKPTRAYAMYVPSNTELNLAGAYDHSRPDTIITLSYTPSMPAADAALDGWNLIGNPYPSSLNWDQMNKTLSNKAISYYDASQSKYISYNAGLPANGNIIPSAQGFWVQASAGGEQVSFSNAARTTQAPNTAYYRLAESYLKLSVKSGTKSDETYFRFSDLASTDYDGSLDCRKRMNGDSTPSLYSMSGGVKYAINSIPPPLSEYRIALQVKAGFKGVYTFTADNISSLPASMDVYLEDRLLHTSQELRSKPGYDFTAAFADTAQRFYIIFREGSAANHQGIVSSAASVQIQGAGEQVCVRFYNTGAESADIAVCNMLGENLYRVQGVPTGSGIYQFYSGQQAPGIYIVKVVTGQGAYTGKVYLEK